MSMNKAGANASWHDLSAEARETLEGWLFDEGLNYVTALARAEKELGYVGSVSSLKRFYQRRAQERVLAGLGAAQSQAAEIEGTAGDAGQLRQAGFKVVAQLFLQQVTEAPEQTKRWGRTAKLLLQSEANDSRRRLKREENHLKRLALEFAREQYEYNALEEAYALLPELKKLERSRQDPAVTEFEYNKQTNLMRRRMFGYDLPDILPENAEEARVMQEEALRVKQDSDAQHAVFMQAARERYGQYPPGEVGS